MTQSTALQAPGFNPDDISIYDRENTRSVVNLLPDGMRADVEKIPQHYRILDERQARTKFRPSPAMNQLRAAFWLEYNKAQTLQKERMDPVNIYAGIVAREYFFAVAMKSKEMVAWMLLPPRAYHAMLNEAWTASMDRLREILDAPLYDKKGRLSATTAQLLVKVFSLLDQRKHGSVVQKNVNVNLSGQEAKEAAIAMQGSTMEALDKRLLDLQKKMASAPVGVSTEVEAKKIDDIG